MTKETTTQPLNEIDELKAAREKVKELEDKLRPVVVNLRFDLWRGDLVVKNQKMNRLTGQSYVTQMRFEFTGRKPERSVTVPQKVADHWNTTRFTARYQATELLFPAGTKQDIVWDLDEENQVFIKTVKELETV